MRQRRRPRRLPAASRSGADPEYEGPAPRKRTQTTRSRHCTAWAKRARASRSSFLRASGPHCLPISNPRPQVSIPIKKTSRFPCAENTLSEPGRFTFRLMVTRTVHRRPTYSIDCPGYITSGSCPTSSCHAWTTGGCGRRPSLPACSAYCTLGRCRPDAHTPRAFGCR